MDKKDVTINASGKKLGRLATEVATILRGKASSSYERHELPHVKVTVTNAGEINITDRKASFIEHKSFSGYPGGLKISKGTHVAAVKGKRELLRKAVQGMIPKNKLRPRIMKNLTITE
jgi:large subunit ribosomal protein L13